ncbi:MAG: EAL domain-containing protein [Thiobacillaceae bacterium]|nr:EAL domain-containing protein [Thiobacillaceae bacterium]
MLLILWLLGYLLLGGLLFLSNLWHTRAFLQQQLASHAQDAATALALQLSPALARGDTATLANTVDALFDSGYYQRIQLHTVAAQPILQRELAVRVAGVPSWFIRWVPLSPPPGRAEALAGWRRAAVVEVLSHPGHAYQHLWRSVRSTLAWTLAIGAVSALLLFAVFRRALRPLQALEHQALQVAEGRFGHPAVAPRIRELAAISRAMQHMSAAIERMLTEQRRRVDQLQRELHHDALTGLPNRAYLITAAEAALAERGPTVALAILRLNGLAELNAQRGRAEGDALLRATAQEVSRLATQFNGLAARLDGGQFAILIEQTEPHGLTRLAQRLAAAGAQVLSQQQVEALCQAHVGAALARAARRTVLFADADAALRDARLGPSGGYRLATRSYPNATDIRAALIEAIRQGSLHLEWQPVLRCRDAGLDHYEAQARIPAAAGELLPAGAFICLAAEAGLIATLDELIVTRAWLDLDGKRTPGAVNLAAASLVSAGFTDWLIGLIHDPALLRLEVNLDAVRNTAGALDALRRLKTAGFPIVFDRFVPQDDSLLRLAELRPQAVKIDSALCRQAREDSSTRALIATLCAHARELGVSVGASGIEHEEERTLLCGLGVDYLQGRLVGPHEPI